MPLSNRAVETLMTIINMHFNLCSGGSSLWIAILFIILAIAVYYLKLQDIDKLSVRKEIDKLKSFFLQN